MDNKIDDILQRYPLKVVSQKRARGAVMLCAEDGTYIIKKYEGSVKKLRFQKLVQDKLLMDGYDLIDEIIFNYLLWHIRYLMYFFMQNPI